MRLGAAGKDKRKITTAVSRELLGFIWAALEPDQRLASASGSRPDKNQSKQKLS
jgi:hypothetical protein